VALTIRRNCPVFKKHMEIARIMAFDNLPFLKAKLLMEKNINSSRVAPVKSLRNFPPSGYGFYRPRNSQELPRAGR